MTHKTCRDCKSTKPIEQFYLCKDSRSGIKRRQSYCRLCSRSRAMKWYRDHDGLENSNRNRRTRKYGLSNDDFEGMKIAQDNKCRICRKTPKVLCIDHCHLTGMVRGLLCTQCNTGLAMFDDCTGLMIEAIDYLKRAQDKYINEIKAPRVYLRRQPRVPAI